jgi:SAM-dependent methyltransferase
LDFFNNIIGETKVDRQIFLYNETNLYLKNSKIDIFNPGFYPISEYIKSDNNVLNYYISLYLFLINDIDTTNKNVLDICCGRGGGLLAYKQYTNFNNFYGFDINNQSIEFCKSNHKDINFEIMNIDNILYKDNMFNVITLIDSLAVSNNKELFFNNIKRILKNNGVFSFAEEQLNKDTYRHLAKNFNKIIKKDITKNIIDACTLVINNINTFNISEKEKEYLLYCSMNNYNHYSKYANFFNYICFNEEK